MLKYDLENDLMVLLLHAICYCVYRCRASPPSPAKHVWLLQMPNLKH